MSRAGPPPETQIELYHHFVGDAEYAGVEALIEGFSQREPGVTIDERGEEELSLKVKSRILTEDPPDVWDAWPGETLRPYNNANSLMDLTDLWDRRDLADGYVEGTIEAARVDGQQVAVPLDVYRINNLFYNVEYVDRAGVDPSNLDSPRALLDVLDTIDAELDAIAFPLHMRDPFGVLQFWETLLLAEHGPAVYESVIDGGAGDHRDAIRESLSLLEAFATFAPDDALFYSTVDTDERVVDGEAVFKHDGDWAAGVFLDADDFTYGSDWDHIPFPGTDGCYQLNMNALVASAESTNQDAVKSFLAYAGSVDGLHRFNEAKGSLPPRADVPVDEFSPFHRDQHAAFEQSRAQPLSITHGLAVEPDRLTELKTAVASFVTEFDVEETTSQFVDALKR